MPGIKFYVDNLPGAPFDFFWEITPWSDKVHAPTEEDPEAWRWEVQKDMWALRMVSTLDPELTEVYVLNSLDDDTLRMAAGYMANRYVSRNRAKALEEGPVELVRSDDA